MIRLLDTIATERVLDFVLIVASGVALLSAAAWLASLMFSKRPAARRQILGTALLCSLGTPFLAASFLATGWSLFAVPLLPSESMAASKTLAPIIDVSLVDEGPLRLVSREVTAPRAVPTPAVSLPEAPPSPRKHAPALMEKSKPVQTPAAAFSWRSAAAMGLAAWAIGSIRLLWSLAWGVYQVLRIRKQAKPITEPSLLAMLADVSKRLGVRSTPALVASTFGATPFAAGFGRSTIVLPTGLVASLDEEAMHDVLVHEVAHIANFDHVMVVFQELAKVLYWPIPTVHLLVRELTNASEELSDNHVLRGRDPIGYGETLLQLAESSLIVKAPRASVGILPWNGALERRIAGLLDRTRDRTTRSSRSLALLALTGFAAIGTIASATRFSAAQEAPSPVAVVDSRAGSADSPQSAGRTMLVRVVGLDGEPIAGVKVLRSAWLQDLTRDYPPNYQGTTNAQGQLNLPIPNGVRMVQIWASLDGYVPLFAVWEEEDLPEENLPSEFTFDLERGTVLGGVVQDEDGRPIPDAAVFVELTQGGRHGPKFSPHKWLTEYAPNSKNNAVATDAEGRWSIDVAPPGDDVQVKIQVSHPNFQTAQTGGDDLQNRHGADIGPLRERTSSITLKRGIQAVGTVRDADGNPLAGAVVVVGDRPYWQPGSQEVLTDAQGVFQLPALTPNLKRLTVVAEGWMPETRVVTLAPEMGPVDFQLRKGVEQLVRVVDREGSPLPGVSLSIRSWRGVRSLYNYDHPSVKPTKIPLYTDADGRFRWTWAPDDPVTYRLSKPGRMNPEVTLTADGREQTIVLDLVARISGTIADAQGNPIEGAIIMPVVELRGGHLSVERSKLRHLAGVDFEMEFDRADVAHRVRVEAPGYRSVMSDAVQSDGTDLKVDFRLEAAPPVQGRVLWKGQPVAGANVLLGTASQGLSIGSTYSRLGRMPTSRNADALNSETDVDGVFQFPAQFEPFVIVAAHAEGYAEVEAEAEADGLLGDVILQPWMRIEGRVMRDGQPAPLVWVQFSPIHQRRNASSLHHLYAAETDESGRYVFGQVPPVKGSITLLDHRSAQSVLWSSSRFIPLEGRPGERLEINFGDQQATVLGRVIDQGPVTAQILGSSCLLVRKAPGVESSTDVPSIGFDVTKGWDEVWATTIEGSSYLETVDYHRASLNAEGRFRIDDVSPGEYDLVVRLYEASSDVRHIRPVGVRVVPVHVEKADVDLGDISVQMKRVPHVGELAPDFSFTTFDGESVSPADLRGRYVLLDFWTSWGKACVPQRPVLQRLHDLYGGDGRLTILGLSLDDDLNEARRFVQEHKATWMNGPAGEELRDRYVVRKAPTYVLIDPDGRIVHDGVTADEVEQVLRRLLK